MLKSSLATYEHGNNISRIEHNNKNMLNNIHASNKNKK